MQITIEACGPARQWLGAADIPLTLDDGRHVADATALLAARFPEFAPHRARCACAIGDAIVDGNHLLDEGERLTLIPPVSGG